MGCYCVTVSVLVSVFVYRSVSVAVLQPFKFSMEIHWR